MTLPASGAISVGDICTEFGITPTNISFSSLYRANGYTSGAVAANGIANISSNFNIVQSGTIALGQFYSAQKGFKYVATISANTADYVLSDAANTAGWNGIMPIDATITINSSQFVYSTSTSTAGFRLKGGTDNVPGGTVSRIRLINNGVISGKGGAGAGAVNVNGFPGGPGLSANNTGYAIDVNNQGTIAGGGGGGGTGQTVTGTDGGEGTATYAGGSGGGGAGYSGGAGGGAITGFNYNGNAASGGSWNAGGAASNGGSGNGVNGGQGGGGGTAGSSGNNGGTGAGSSSVNYNLTSGGAGGAAVYGSSNITWVNNGTRLGTVYN